MHKEVHTSEEPISVSLCIAFSTQNLAETRNFHPLDPVGQTFRKNWLVVSTSLLPAQFFNKKLKTFFLFFILLYLSVPFLVPFVIFSSKINY